VNDHLSIYCDTSGLIAAVEIRNVASRGIQSIALQIGESFKSFQREMRSRFEASTGSESEYEAIAKLDMNNRVISFITESAKERMSESATG
jgi:hypothetical protein